MRDKWCRCALWALGLLVVFNVSAFAQISRGQIAGTVKDDTGAALPGVTVTVTSPALQVPSVVGVSDARGEYRIIDLPAGTFRVQYELSGFGTLVREGIVLTTGFAAKLDIVLKLATLAETVTVSGESPVVDVTTTRGGTTVSQELIQTIPGNNNFRDVMLMVGVSQANNAPLTGGEQAAALGFGGASYGSGTGSSNVEGMRMLTFQPADFSAYQEVDVKTFGNTADVDQPGANVQLVVKSGGNQFHGRYSEIYQNDSFASDNIDDKLRAQGINKGDSIIWFSDFNADLGGRIIRDKLWFYGAYRNSHNKFSSTGFVTGPGPDGVYQTGDEPPAYPKDWTFGGIGKVSYQMNAQNRFVFLWHENNDHYAAYYTRYAPSSRLPTTTSWAARSSRLNGTRRSAIAGSSPRVLRAQPILGLPLAWRRFRAGDPGHQRPDDAAAHGSDVERQLSGLVGGAARAVRRQRVVPPGEEHARLALVPGRLPGDAGDLSLGLSWRRTAKQLQPGYGGLPGAGWLRRVPPDV